MPPEGRRPQPPEALDASKRSGAPESLREGRGVERSVPRGDSAEVGALCDARGLLPTPWPNNDVGALCDAKGGLPMP
eukprot:7613144-Pyramimonas_sp.AAC.1